MRINTTSALSATGIIAYRWHLLLQEIMNAIVVMCRCCVFLIARMFVLLICRLSPRTTAFWKLKSFQVLIANRYMQMQCFLSFSLSMIIFWKT